MLAVADVDFAAEETAAGATVFGAAEPHVPADVGLEPVSRPEGVEGAENEEGDGLLFAGAEPQVEPDGVDGLEAGAEPQVEPDLEELEELEEGELGLEAEEEPQVEELDFEDDEDEEEEREEDDELPHPLLAGRDE